MYLDRFGLQRPPFEETANPDFCFETDALRSVCAAARAQVAGDGGIVLIEGQSGAGKTMLAHLLALRLRDEACILAQISARDESERVLARIAAAVNVATPVDGDINDHVSRLINVLAERGEQPGVVLIDDAERLSADDLLALQQLINAAAKREMKLVVVLISTAAIKVRLRLPEVREIARRMCRTPQLFHPDPSDTAAYLATRLRAAGATSAGLFSPAATARIAQLACGKMRQINALADAALQRAAELNRDGVDVDLIGPPDVECAAATLPANASSSDMPPHDRSQDAPRLPDPAELARMERIVERFAELTEYAPQRIGALDSAFDRLHSRADGVFHDATRQIDKLEQLCERYGRNETNTSEQLPQLENLTTEAGQLHRRLTNIVEQLGDVDTASQERIALLLSGLDSAEEIHNKLESAGEQVTGLIEESRQAAITERDALVGIYEQLSARREELSAMIDGLRHERQKVLEENELAIAEMIDRCRTDAAKACETSANALAEARSTAGANRAQLAEADRQSEAIAARANGATSRLGETVGRADEIAGKLAKDIDLAGHLRQGYITTLERVQAESVRAIEHGADQADQRLRDALARFETLVATEQSARTSAGDAVKAARTALASVQQSETKLAAAQSAAIDIEATASAALTTVQQQIKRFDDSVGAIVQHGLDKARVEITAMLDGCAQRAADTSTALEEAVTAGVRRAHDDIAKLFAETRSEQERMGAEIAAALEHHKSASVAAMAAARDEVGARYSAEIETAAQAATDRFREELTDRQCAASAAIELAGERNRASVVETGEESVSAARDRILSTAAGAAQSLESEISAARSVADKLTQEVAGTEKLLADAHTTREQIDHQIRDVWSLTSTTDQRARALAALADQAATSESNLAELLADAARRAGTLATQSDIAHKGVELLTAQQSQVKDICTVFSARIAEARQVCADVTAANETGRQLHPELSARGKELQQLLAGAAEIVENIHRESETARTTTVTVEQMGTLVAALEGKVIELQESLANPMAIIQDARGQADELNEICLAVKRVFRGVSQASLQANDRIKMLGKLLMATERSTRTIKQWVQEAATTMKQWVQEAATTQARLADTIAQAPSIADTHPMVALPAAYNLLGGLDDRGVNIAADDRATIHRAAQRPERAAVANASTGGKPATAVAPAPLLEKTVEPLATVLKARQAKSGSAPTPRLSPADVQQMIDAARHDAESGE